ncbi:aldo/keto reductase [Kocuria sp. cx-455]|uniref:aldo/keto reductase n=1 Tax=unclassified Candidatus Sulfotelmatobacter TaxID=2635724 RepID=UPI001685B59E|nr:MULTISPECIES: aldo/keto reductase [unclassified Candidatus Sulfotelmatobacter]MBD2762621.1 aldo/keto reductase [Kocuria sp. cx-116]MBD2765333.1 aldo/keto reductase [Kocuria sp. cx-455]
MSDKKLEDAVPDVPRHVLRDGTKIPQLGLGTYPMDDAEAEALIPEALWRGYRLVDTAVNYGNELGVGRGIKASEITRDEIFLTTKLPGRDHGTDSVRRSLEGSLERLGTDYVDLYLIHWPNPGVDRYVETWQTMIELRDQGLVRSIGVSNFLPEHLLRLERETGEMPVINQVELHPQYQQELLREFHAEHKIVTEAWSPLGRKTDILQHEWIADIARKVGRTPAQVMLRWHIQSNILPIPKTSNVTRMAENLDVFDWDLTDEQMKRMKMLHTGLSGSGFDPREHEEL